MTEYQRWLRASYLYYIQPGAYPGMPDCEWDALSRKFYAERQAMTLPEHAPIHRPEFTGGSLFWLRANEYPASIIQPLINHFPHQIDD